MIISKFFISFIIFSFFGWIYETIYCTVKSHHWDNRGFLFGPVCPIYGSGAIIGALTFKFLSKYIGEDPAWWKVFLICMIGSAVLEYLTSYVLEKIFHAVWWDYRDMPLHLNGRICLPASLAFGFAGIFIIKYAIPFVFDAIGSLHPTVIEGLALFLMIYFAADIALTVSGLTEIVKKIEEFEKEFNAKMEGSYQVIEGKRQLVSAKVVEYERLTTEKIKDYTRTMTHAQQHALMSMKRFTLKGYSAIAEKFKDALRGISVIKRTKETNKEESADEEET